MNAKDEVGSRREIIHSYGKNGPSREIYKWNSLISA